MRLDRLFLQNFRNVDRADLTFSQGLNLIVGPNAAGKTNLLEAIHVACSGFSQRTARDDEMVRWGRDHYVVRGIFRRQEGRREILVSFGHREGKRVRLDGKSLTRRSELLRVVAAVTFSPQDLDLVQGGPDLRRKFLDRLASRMDPRHAADLWEFRRVLNQRNHLLRQIREQGSLRETLRAFDAPFAECAARILARRMRVIRRLGPLAEASLRKFGDPTAELQLRYLEGGTRAQPANEETERWEHWLDVAFERLQRMSRQEEVRGQTLWGPQRDDLGIELRERDARVFASQGQQRSIVLALKYGEMELAEESLGSEPLLLLDDVLSELDPTRARSLLEAVENREQSFLTTTESSSGLLGGIRSGSVFEVRNGVAEERSPV